jgi:hypothetical protein
VAINTWYYLVYDFVMTAGTTTTVKLFLDDAQDGTATWSSNVFVIDNASFPAYVGIARTTDASTYDHHWNGYIHDLHVYVNKPHETTDTTHFAASCGVASACWTVDFD